MAQTEWGWGGICQCSHWGSKVECKMSVFVYSNTFYFCNWEICSGTPTFFPTVRVSFVRKKKSETELPPPVLLYVVRLLLLRTCKVRVCVGGGERTRETWRPVTSSAHTPRWADLLTLTPPCLHQWTMTFLRSREPSDWRALSLVIEMLTFRAALLLFSV